MILRLFSHYQLYPRIFSYVSINVIGHELVLENSKHKAKDSLLWQLGWYIVYSFNVILQNQVEVLPFHLELL